MTAATDFDKPTVVFDGGCSFCRRQELRIKRLDWLHRFDTMPYEAAIIGWPEVARGSLGEGLRVRFPDSTVTVGIEAVRSIAVRMPLTALPALLLWIPGFYHLGRAAYRYIAANRRRDRDDETGSSCSF